jgi:hypothetical protein
MSIGTIILIILIIALLGGFSGIGGGPFYGTGYYGGGGLGLVIVILLILLLFGSCEQRKGRRWVRSPHRQDCHHPRKRVIQYSRDDRNQSRGRGVLDTRLRGYDSKGKARAFRPASSSPA